MLLRQFLSPIVLILIGAAILSSALGDATDALIIVVIVLVSGLLGFWQERGAANAVDALLQTVALKAHVLRDGGEQLVPVDQLVPGDVVRLSAGAGIPADARLLQAQDLLVDEAALTGEGYPVEKRTVDLDAGTPLAQRINSLFLGTHVISGTATAVVVRVGRETEFGAIERTLQQRPKETEFESGVRHFGYLLMQFTLLMVLAIFAANTFMQRPLFDSFLFALALAVGLMPQLLPAIISVNLARGAKVMATQKVIVKRLAAIENFGSMDVLCADKTGTLTDGKVRVHSALDLQAQDSERVLRMAFVNASFESGFGNPIDDSIRTHRAFDLTGWAKLGEIPYDFTRKRLSVLVQHDAECLLVVKGALQNVLQVCTQVEAADGSVSPIADSRTIIDAQYAKLGGEGFRTLGVAVRTMQDASPVTRDAESGMTFLGMLVLEDPPKAGVRAAVDALRALGVRLKMITGDNALVAAHVGASVGLDASKVLTGADLRILSDDALPRRAQQCEIFAEIEPNQKQRIILALRKAGHVVGYMGDGINDAPALHAADVSISVQDAVDVAKQAADIVLLEQDLAVLESGVRSGRRTFANTLKYVFMATSANFGNMFSMAGASLFLPFLPLLPKQILLTNLLTDIPELTIASDHVDPDWLATPRRWDIVFIRRFMLTFGLVSSVFDYVTFGALLLLLHAGTAEFRTGWFVESVVSATMIVLVVRTRHSAFASRPSAPLLLAVLAIVALTIALPYTALGAVFGFVPLPAAFLALLAVIVVAYIFSAELAKRWFHARFGAPVPVPMAAATASR